MAISSMRFSKYGKNPAFYSENRGDAGFLSITSGCAAQSSAMDNFATPRYFPVFSEKKYLHPSYD